MLTDVIKSLIARRTEGGYWDFKQQWHSEGELLKDIICLANNLTENDGLLIFGITSDYTICGVENDSGRKNLATITQFISSKPFAFHVPEVFLETVIIDGHEIDVLRIKTTNKTPYYLSNNILGIEQGVIYSRLNDTNTGNSSHPTSNQMTEILWKKRFGLNLNIVERLDFLLEDYSNWGVYSKGLCCEWIQGGDFENLNYIYHKNFSEFRIEVTQLHDFDCEGFCFFYLDENATLFDAKVYYHSTLLREFQIVAVDGFRGFITNPKISGFGNIHFYYICLNEIEGKVLKILTKGTFDVSTRIPLQWLLIFENQEELEDFKHFAKSNQNLFDNSITSLGIVPDEEDKVLPALSTTILQQAYHFYSEWKKQRGF